MDDASADVALSAGGLMVSHAQALMEHCDAADCAAAVDLSDRAAGVCLQIMNMRQAGEARYWAVAHDFE
jgi:hypothetical protein